MGGIGGFKDLSELHIAAVDSGQPEMFNTVLEVAIWRARFEAKHSSSSSSPYSVNDDDEEKLRLKVEPFSKLPRYAGTRPSIVEKVFPKGFPISIYGEGGIAKSITGLHLCTSVAAGKEEWLGFRIPEQMPVLYVDFELDREEQGTRGARIAKGLGIDVPDDLHYLWASGHRFSDVFSVILEAVGDLAIGVVALDSLGMALEGDAVKGETVIDFFRDRMDQLKRRSVSPLIIDHQSGLRPGEHYQNKAQYGSVYKGYLSRSRIQLELSERDDEGISVIVRQNKSNFGAPFTSFMAHTAFNGPEITLTREELAEEDLREEFGLNAQDRVLLALLDGPSYPGDLSEKTGLTAVSNVVTKLKNRGLARPTGKKVGKAHEVELTSDGTLRASKIKEKLSLSSSHTLRADDDDEESGAPENPKERPKGQSGEETLPEGGELVTDEGRARDVIEWLKTLPSVALDIETYGKVKRDGLLYTRAKPRLLTFHSSDTTYHVDLNHVDTALSAEMLRAIEGKPKHLHNALFDLPRLYRHTGVLLSDNVRDTLVASRIARAGEWQGKGKQIDHGLEHALERDLGRKIGKDKELKWGGELTPKHLEYAAEDVLYLEELFESLKGRMHENGTWSRYEAVSATLPTFLKAAITGVPVDADALREFSDATGEEAANLEARLEEMGPEHPEGEHWRWGNTHKPGTLDQYGNKVGRNGALRALEILGVSLPNTEDQTLIDHRDDHKIMPIFQQYKKAAREHSRYRKWLTDFYEDGRIYPQPKVAGAVTGRLLYSDPNIQGVEKRKTKKYRRTLRAPEGRCIVSGDFEQQELRIAAHFSQDKSMLDTFTAGGDIYLKTAEKMVGRPVGKDDPERAGAKRATLGFLYGLGTEKYRANTYKDYGIKLSKTQAEKDRRAFRSAFPDFYKWQKEYGGRGQWETRSVLGWRRVVAPDKDGGPKYTDRLNGPIQSTAGDVLYLALAKMAEDPFPEAQFLAGVHDEIVLEAPESTAVDAARWLKAKMVEAFNEVLGQELGGPRSVEVACGPSWGELKEVKG